MPFSSESPGQMARSLLAAVVDLQVSVDRRIDAAVDGVISNIYRCGTYCRSGELRLTRALEGSIDLPRPANASARLSTCGARWPFHFEARGVNLKI